MDLETRLRDTMDRRTHGIGTRSMPLGTVSRVRRRRAVGLVIATTLAITFVGGVTGLIRLTADRSSRQPAAGETVSIPPPTDFDVTYVTPAPFADLAPGEWPDVRVGEVPGPYVDHETGEEAWLRTDKAVVASGYVEGTEWSMTAFATEPDGGIVVAWGTCADLFLGDWGDYGGVRACTDVRGEPGQKDLRMAGASFGEGPVTSYVGVVSAVVDHVVFEFADGSHRPVGLIDGPAGLDARYFVLFVPNDAAGTVSAVDAAGARMATEPLCVGESAARGEVAGCGNGMSGVASAVSTEH